MSRSRARLWEMSIVIALRDAQWNFRLPDLRPEPYLPIAGGLEFSGADAMLKIGGRLFFFEIKAERKGIREEWNKKRGRRRSKLAFRSAIKALLMYGTPSMEDGLPRTLHLSLQCHHFVYWTSGDTGAKRAGRVVLEPYLLATIRERLMARSSTKRAAIELQNAYKLGMAIKSDLVDDAAHDFALMDRSPLEWVAQQKAALIRRDSEGDHFWSHLGLALPEFKEYLAALLASQGAGHKKINAVVMAGDGSFFQHVTDTSQLEAIFFPSAEMQPSVTSAVSRAPDTPGGRSQEKVGAAADVSARKPEIVLATQDFERCVYPAPSPDDEEGRRPSSSLW